MLSVPSNRAYEVKLVAWLALSLVLKLSVPSNRAYEVKLGVATPLILATSLSVPSNRAYEVKPTPRPGMCQVPSLSVPSNRAYEVKRGFQPYGLPQYNAFSTLESGLRSETFQDRDSEPLPHAGFQYPRIGPTK